MIEPGESLADGELDRIAALHHASIRDSLATFLGRRYLRRLYRFFAASPLEWVFLERQEGRLEGACVVSLEPGSVYPRIARATGPALAGATLWGLLRSRDLRRFLLGFLGDRLRRRAETSREPEITYIFARGERRGRGLGRRLVERAEGFLRERGFERYTVRTADEPSNRALAFYDGAGFLRVATRTEAGRSFVVFEKPLDAGRRRSVAT